MERSRRKRPNGKLMLFVLVPPLLAALLIMRPASAQVTPTEGS